jgi:hypothetical protein
MARLAFHPTNFPQQLRFLALDEPSVSLAITMNPRE